MRVVPLAFVLLVAFAVDATADRSVDWSQYIEQPGDRPLKVTSGEAPRVVTAAADEAPAKASKRSKASKAKQSKKSHKAKARRTKARAKKRK
jgi:hypothetical protein